MFNKNLDETFIVGFAKSYVDNAWEACANNSEKFVELKNIASSFEILGNKEWYPDLYFKHAMKSFKVSLDNKFKQNFIENVIDYTTMYINDIRKVNPNISYVEIAKSLKKEKILPVEKEGGRDVLDPLDYYISYLNEEFKKEYIHRDEICAATASIICIEEIHKAQQYGSKMESIPNIPLRYKDGTDTLQYFNYMIKENNIGVKWNANLNSSTFIDGNENASLSKGLGMFRKIPLGAVVIERMIVRFNELMSSSNDSLLKPVVDVLTNKNMGKDFVKLVGPLDFKSKKNELPKNTKKNSF